MIGSQRKGLRRRLFFGTALIPIAGVALVLWPRDQLLTNVATPIPVSRTLLGYEQREYCWISNRHVLIQAGPHVPSCFGNWRPDSPCFQTALIDRFTGYSTPLAPFDARLNGHRPFHRFPPRVILLPTASYALVEDGLERLSAVGLYDGREAHSQGKDDQIVIASADGHRLYSVDRDTERRALEAKTFSVEHPNVCLASFQATLPPFFPRDWNGVRLCGVTKDGMLVFQRMKDVDLLPSFIIADLNCQPVRFHAVAAKLPSGANVEESVLSPDGDRIAWALDSTIPHADSGGALIRILRRLLGGREQPSEDRGVYVSRLDGSDCQRVGHIPYWPGNTNAYDYIDQLKWLPDAHHISFVLHDELWVASAQ